MTREEEQKLREAREASILNSDLTTQQSFKTSEAARVLRLNRDQARNFLARMCRDKKLEKVRDKASTNGGVVYRIPGPDLLSMNWRHDHSVYSMLEGD